MKSFMEITLQKLFPVSALHYRAYKRLIRDRSSYLYSTGWMQSLEERKPVGSEGKPIPWMNFPVVSLLAERLAPDLTLFEFGSGYSTFFFASRVSSVTSVEYDPRWLATVRAGAPENVRLILQEEDVDGEYCRVVASAGDQYDVVVVDGRDRVNCVKQSVPVLSPRGVLVLDDSQRERYLHAIAFAKESGFRALNLEGLKATDGGMHRTTIFYREENCLGI